MQRVRGGIRIIPNVEGESRWAAHLQLQGAERRLALATRVLADFAMEHAGLSLTGVAKKHWVLLLRQHVGQGVSLEAALAFAMAGGN